MVLERVRAVGVILSADGDKLRYEAPKGILTPDLRQALAHNKQAILEILETDRLADRLVVQRADCSDPFADFAQAIRNGALQQCQACRHFSGVMPPGGDNLGVPDAGWCRQYQTATDPLLPFWCDGYCPAVAFERGARE